jgi:hypothetical protein
MQQEKITLEYKNNSPVELTDLTNALTCFGEQYKRFVINKPEIKTPMEAKLFIKEIRTGSIITDLIPFTPILLPIIAEFNIVLSFCEHIKRTYSFFIGKSTDIPKIDKTDCTHLSSILTPVAKDNGSQLNCSYVHNGPVFNVINVNSLEANAAQNSIIRYRDSLFEPVIRNYKNVVMYWYQARNEPSCQTGDKGLIESIYSKPIKILFANDELKSNMLLDKENPFRFAYVVTVTVETIENIPVAYKIMSIHDKFERT